MDKKIKEWVLILTAIVYGVLHTAWILVHRVIGIIIFLFFLLLLSIPVCEWLR